MAELDNRDDLEADFALRISRLTTKQRKEFESLLGFPPDPNNVPQEFWDRVQQEFEDNMLTILLLIAASSYSQHGGPLVQPDEPSFDQAVGKLLQTITGTKEPPAIPPSPLVQWARDVSSQTAQGFVDHSQEMLRTAADDWTNPETPDPTNRDVRDTALKIFGPDRASRIAVNETTRAQHVGSEEAVAATVGVSPEDRWFTRNDRRVCPICTPLHDTPRSYWGRFFGGPPDPHPLCRCYIVYANEPAEAVA